MSNPVSPSERLRAAAERLSDAIADRAAAGRSHLDITVDVDAAYLDAVKALRAALAESVPVEPPPALLVHETGLRQAFVEAFSYADHEQCRANGAEAEADCAIDVLRENDFLVSPAASDERSAVPAVEAVGLDKGRVERALSSALDAMDDEWVVPELAEVFIDEYLAAALGTDK